MITTKIATAMATATTRHNSDRQQKLVVFYKALEIIKSATTETWESKVVFAGTLGGKKAQVILKNDQNRITLNLIVEGKTFQPLKMTAVVNENDYLAWNLRVRKEQMPPAPSSAPARPPRANKITAPKAVSKKAKSHDVTPLDHDTFRVTSESGGEYFVRLLHNEDGGMCDCAWGQHRRYVEKYRSGCSHVQAVYQQLESHRNRTTSAWPTKEDAKRQHRQMADIGDGVILTLRKK